MPLNALKLQEKVQDEDRVHKVYEGITHIALGLKMIRMRKILSSPWEGRSNHISESGFC